ncbi:MAG: PAS domain S-box protein [Desulfatitalea sp.]|nr:PAS domain S-box protein [Desulfatitalea sp.]NNJ98854.1 PAS domain S-box protein [Desulfatitalea sp.]
MSDTESFQSKRKEAQLRYTHRTLRSIFKHLPFGIICLDEKLRVLYGNFGGLRFEGGKTPYLPTVDLMGKYFHESLPFIDPAQLEVVETTIKKVFDEGAPITLTIRHETSTGPVFHELWIKPEKDKTGNVVSVLGIAHDISQIKRSEEALFDSEQKYRSMIENALVGIFIHQDGKIQFANKRFCDICGYTYEELVNKKSALDLIHPDEFGGPCQEKTTLFRSDQNSISGVHLNIQKKDGTTVKVSILGGNITYKGRPAICHNVLDITEQARVQEELQHKTAVLEAQLNASPDGIVVTNNDEVILQNRRVSELFKIPPEIEMDLPKQEKWVWDMLKHPEKAKEQVAFVYEQPDKISRAELELNDGRILDIFSGPVLGKDGRAYGRIATHRDITEQKRSELALRARQIQLSQAMELANIVYWELDLSTYEFILNDPFYALHGTTAEQEGGYRMTGNDYVNRFMHPDDQPRYFQLARETAEQPWNSAFPDFEHRIIRRDGNIRHIVSRVRLVRDDDGATVKVYGTTQDITERKQMESAVQESEALFRKVFEESPLGMLMADADLRFIRVNEAFCNMLGYSEQELGDLAFKDILHPEHMAEHKRYMADLINGAAPVHRAEKPYLRKDKELVWACATISVIRDGTGRFLYFLSTVEDVTRQKKVQEEKIRLESQLRQVQKMEAVGTLAGGIAHDFNNMLGVILGHADLALNDVDPRHALHANIKEIRNAAERSADLTRQLLAFARKQTVTPKVLDLNQTIEGMLKMLRRLIGEDIELSWLPGSEVWPLKIDPSQIDQILANLCVNARDAIQNMGKLTIETGTASMDEDDCHGHVALIPGEYVLLVVSDNGKGMDQKTMEKIFDPFFTTKQVGKGTGLGLATVYGIIKQNNGFVYVYSEPGYGTTFRIYLPRYSGKEDPLEKRSQAAPLLGGHETILLVEDEPAILNMARMALEKYGYQVLPAVSPKEALLMAKTHRGTIDLLLTDLVMPQMNGKKLADTLMPLCPKLKYLFMSGYTANVIAHHGVLDDGVNFLQKPFSAQVLITKVHEVLNDA